MDKYLICDSCGVHASTNESLYACPKCGSSMHTAFDIENNKEEVKEIISQGKKFWDYKALTTLKEDTKPISMGEGNTPLVSCSNISNELGISYYVKNETLNPSGTFKDRCMSVSISKAQEFGAEGIIIGSAGNAGAAAAAYSAKSGLPCYVLIPSSTILARITQTIMYGAKVILINGTVNNCIDLIKELSSKPKFHNVTTASRYNPYQADGPKMIAYDLARDMNWTVPDWIITPMGGGGILSSIWQGYKDMYSVGLIDKLPKMVGMQASGCAAIVKAFNENKSPQEIEDFGIPNTIAAAIADPFPLDGWTALQAIYDSNGYSLMVDDEDILKGQYLLSSNEGIFPETASSTTVIGTYKLVERGIIKKGESVVSIITGTGLKDISYAAEKIKKPPVIDNSLEKLVELLKYY